MKIRNGFVSNSSSASYIIKIYDTTLEDFCNKFANEYSFSFFNLEEFEKSINERLMEERARLDAEYEELSKVNSSISIENADDKWFISHLKKNITYFTDTLEKIKELKDKPEQISDTKRIDYREIMDFILEHNRIGVWERESVETNKKYVEVADTTTMHNSFVEGMNDITKEMIFYFMSNGKKVTLDIDRADY